MTNTLITRISNLDQYDSSEKQIVWEDSVSSRWAKTYGKLKVNDNAIFINRDSTFFGVISKITLGKSVTVDQIQELDIKNDELLQLDQLYPELISRVKANFQPFLHEKELNIEKLIDDIKSDNFVSYYIFNSKEDFKDRSIELHPNDRIVILKEGVIENIMITKARELTLAPFNNLLNSSGKSLKQLLKITEDYKGKDSNSNNVRRIRDIITALKKHRFYKFNSFFAYHDTLYNARIYGGRSTSQHEEEEVETQISNIALNQILYGPPGTGKTYNTINKALKIIGEKEEKDLDWNDRKAVKDQFDKRASEGRIVFTTFHQSMSYEDFIEGIKPVLENEDADNESVETDELKYEIKDGIFKNITNLARGVAVKIEKSTEIDFDNKNFYKMSLGGKHRPEKHNWSIKNNLIFLGWGEDKDFTDLTKIKDWKTFRDTFKEKYPELVKESKYVIQAVFTFQAMKNGDIVFVTKGNNIIDAIGIITGDYFYDDTKEIDNYQFRKVKWLATELNASPDIFVNKKISQQTIYQFYNDDIKTEVLDDYFNMPSDKNASDKKYVLIIDEINRGNVSQIFGELITLIEPDKRINREEALEIMLPYSKLKFGVPDNLYIIGTMNTADRSVEALDTALRRRFCFEEMMPRTELLSPSAMYCNLLWEYENVDWEDNRFLEKETDLFKLLGVSEELITQRKNIWDTKMHGKSRSDLSHFSRFKYTGIDLELLLNTINSRIEILLDRDHTIGHSYFLKIANENDLRSTFKNNILPLLQEYFYGDYEKIGLVLGEGFFQKNEEKNKVIFPKFYNAQKPDYKTQYTLVQIDDDFDIVAAIEKLIDKKVVTQTFDNE